LGVLGFAALKHARRCHYRSYGGCGHHGHSGWHGWQGHHGHGPWGGFGHRPPWIHAALARLDATPAQERAIITELDKLRERVHASKVNLREGRSDLAAALRGASLDDAALGAVLGRVDGMTAEVRAAVVDAVRNIHAVLDDRQRDQLAQLLDGGWWRGRGGPGAGPYRM
jgi:Spy/CpxP family protein refolding chaperone